MNLPPDLPDVPLRRLAVTVTPDALRQVRGGHPWVFGTSVRSAYPEGVPGQLAVVFGARREFVAIGLYDPGSPIRVRILHHGQPRAIDESFWRERVTAALALRRPLIDASDTTAFRILHGENDGFGGLVADLYEQTLVLKLYSEAWLPRLRAVIEALTWGTAAEGREVEVVVVRLNRTLRDSRPGGLVDGMAVVGDSPAGPVAFMENGLRFEADVVGGPKTGHFLDQRENRALVATFSGGRRVLDAFACTGGFSVGAAAAGAKEVVSVDSSRRSLELATRNMELNRARPAVAACDHRVRVADAFAAMTDMTKRGETFGLVVVDPPSFAHNERDRAGALRAYRRLADLGVALTAPGGVYAQSSCSSRVDTVEFAALVRAAIADTGRRFEVRAQTGHPLDHPVGFPQGAYLKTLVCRLEPRS